MAANGENESGIHDGHRNRMREKFRKNGFDGMYSHEILEMLLFYSIPRRNTNKIAHDLIDRFGSLTGVFEASEEQLTAVDGITQSSATLIKMIIPLYNEYKKETNSAKRLDDPHDCGKFLVEYYSGMMKERITVICIDASCRILGFEEVCDGDASGVMVNFRRIVEIVMKYPLASAVIIAHNHPGGIALPSREDITATGELRKTLEPMGISLVDHIIIAGDDYISMSSSECFKSVFK